MKLNHDIYPRPPPPPLLTYDHHNDFLKKLTPLFAPTGS